MNVHIVLPTRILEASLVGLLDSHVTWAVQTHPRCNIIICSILLNGRRVPVFPLDIFFDGAILTGRTANYLFHGLSEVIEFVPGGFHGMLLKYLLVIGMRIHITDVINGLFGAPF